MNEEILIEVIKRLKRSDMIYQIESFLNSQKLSDEEIESYIVTAKNRIVENKLQTLPKIKKIIFCTLLLLSLATLIFFVFILPGLGFRQTILMAIIGSILFTFLSICTFKYYKSWEIERIKEELKNTKSNSIDTTAILLGASIPALIVFFLFYFILKSGKDSFLKRTQIVTKGIIISGTSNTISSLRRGPLNFSSVTVEFINQKGNKVRATEDVGEYEFKKFYKGQKISLIYSSEDEKNISFLVNRSDIIKFTESEERDFEATDLTKLINFKENDEILNYLNKVSFGWNFENDKKVFVNDTKNMMFTKNNSIIVLLTSNMLAMIEFPKQFQQLGYKDITKGENKYGIYQGHRTLENEEYNLTIERVKVIDGIPIYASTLTKK